MAGVKLSGDELGDPPLHQRADDGVIAPGHGPLTTAEHELKFNPFVT